MKRYLSFNSRAKPKKTSFGWEVQVFKDSFRFPCSECDILPAVHWHKNRPSSPSAYLLPASGFSLPLPRTSELRDHRAYRPAMQTWRPYLFTCSHIYICPTFVWCCCGETFWNMTYKWIQLNLDITRLTKLRNFLLYRGFVACMFWMRLLWMKQKRNQNSRH